MQKQIDQLLGKAGAEPKPKQPRQQQSGGSSGLSYRDVLVFLRDKGLDEGALKPVAEAQQREAEQNPPSVLSARWRVEGLRKKVERASGQMEKLAERREALDKEEAELQASLEAMRAELSAAETLYCRVNANDVSDVAKVMSTALDQEVLQSEEAQQALAALERLQKAAVEARKSDAAPQPGGVAPTAPTGGGPPAAPPVGGGGGGEHVPVPMEESDFMEAEFQESLKRAFEGEGDTSSAVAKLLAVHAGKKAKRG